MRIGLSPAPARVTPRRREAGYPLALALAVLLGWAARLYFVLGADFPLHDGALFYAMARDLQRSGYLLPAYASYNSASIPFAYPPLALYAAGLLDDLTPLSLLDVFRFLPLAVSLLTVAAFFLLGRSMLPSRAATALAVLAFGLLPESFRWAIMGGGVTRSLGYLFAILALHQIHSLYADRKSGRALPAAAFAGCAVLSHPELGWFTAYSAALLFAARGRSRAGLVSTVLVALGTLAITAPWWVAVLARHGTTAFLSAASRGGPLYSGLAWLLYGNVTGEAYFPFLGALAFLGVLACLAERRLLVPAWLLLAFLLQPRGARLEAAVPLALLAGLGAADVLLPLLSGALPVHPHSPSRPLEPRAPAHPAATEQAPKPEPAAEVTGGLRPRGRLAVALLAFLLGYEISALRDAQRPYLAALSRDERQAMSWVATNTPESSAFLVVTSDPWGLDRSSEWFPVLAGRVSVATVQGYEWAGSAKYARRIAQNEAAQACAARGAECLEGWARETGVAFTHVYLPRRPPVGHDGECCLSLRSSLSADPRYLLVYDGPGAVIYRRRSGPDAR